jgi:tRNA 2-(methylsulfanyl)-N6-isopentenyladenosine37 hydroxylase
MEKNVLGLRMATDPRWVNIASKNLEDILVDHAYCEQKAASSCISLIVQYADKQDLVDSLTPVVAEEWAHFERVLGKLRDRGLRLGPQRKDEYVERINGLMRKGLVERLLLNALIEARSCERFRLLWKEIKDPDLATFYYELMVSEAGHYRNFLTLAKGYMPGDYVERRWKEILSGEADILKQLEPRADRMH